MRTVIFNDSLIKLEMHLSRYLTAEKLHSETLISRLVVLLEIVTSFYIGIDTPIYLHNLLNVPHSLLFYLDDHLTITQELEGINTIAVLMFQFFHICMALLSRLQVRPFRAG